jgi:hypothetical protein
MKSALGKFGVSKKGYGFMAKINENGKQKYLGFFKNIEDASAAVTNYKNGTNYIPKIKGQK